MCLDNKSLRTYTTSIVLDMAGTKFILLSIRCVIVTETITVGKK